MNHLARLGAVVGLGLAMAFAAGGAEPKPVRMPSAAEIAKIEQAAPEKPEATPAAARKVLVWGRMDAHDPNAYAAKTFEILGRKTGAFAATISEDPDALLAEKLAGFDAIVMNNIHQPDPFLPKDLAQRPAAEQETLKRRNEAIHKAILDFVSGGKGLVGIHAATAAFQKWPAYGDLVGGYYVGHLSDDLPMKVEEPGHPVAAMLGKEFRIRDEIYFFKEPYSRAKLRVLVSLDLSKTADPGKRPDKDYAISWVRPYGQGRVFYSTLGHASTTYWNPAILRHFLAGVQFAIGDLKAEAAPRAEKP